MLRRGLKAWVGELTVLRVLVPKSFPGPVTVTVWQSTGERYILVQKGARKGKDQQHLGGKPQEDNLNFNNIWSLHELGNALFWGFGPDYYHCPLGLRQIIYQHCNITALLLLLLLLLFLIFSLLFVYNSSNNVSEVSSGWNELMHVNCAK